MMQKSWFVLKSSIEIFLRIDGEQRAAAFAYHAFFSLFPLILLLVTAGSFLVDGPTASAAVLGFLKRFIPLTLNDQLAIITTIEGVLASRGQASLLAALGLTYSAQRFFRAMVRGVNRAWGTQEYSWWRLPLQNVVMMVVLASSLMIGLLIPSLLRLIQRLFLREGFFVLSILDSVLFLVPTLALYYGLLLFYKYAPNRYVRLRDVWFPALMAVVFLKAFQSGFNYYLERFADFNAVYGAFGVVVVLLLSIYLMGIIILWGGCLSAARALGTQA